MSASNHPYDSFLPWPVNPAKDDDVVISATSVDSIISQGCCLTEKKSLVNLINMFKRLSSCGFSEFRFYGMIQISSIIFHL